MQGGTSKTVAIVYGTRLEAITMAPLIHALEGHPWLSTVVLAAGEPGADEFRDVFDVFAIGPEAADPGSGPIAPTALAARVADVDAVVATGALAELLGGTDRAQSLVVVDRDDAALLVPAALLHLASTDARAAELTAAGIPDARIAVVGDPATQALGELMADAAGLPNDAMSAAFQDTPKWTEDQQHGYVRETFLHSVLIDPQLRSLLACAASPMDDGRVGERCVEALEQLLMVTDGFSEGDEAQEQVAA